MRLPSLLGHAAHLLRLLWNSPRPSDQLASEYFRSKKYIGAHDRRFISQITFAALRGQSAFDFCATQAFEDLAASFSPSAKAQNETPLREIGAIAACCLVGNAVGVGNVSEALEELLGSDSTDVGERIAAIGSSLAKHLGWSEETGAAFAYAVCEQWNMVEEEANFVLDEAALGGELDEIALETLSVRFCAPAWILARWREALGDWFAAVELAASLMYAAPLSLRVNSLAAKRADVLEALKREGLPARAGKLSPDAVIVEKRANLTQTPLFRDGLIEIQDEASQLAAYALNPEPQWKIFDACAGAGGKTLHLAALQRDRGAIVAADVEYQRLKELPFRARRAGVASAETVTIERGTDDGAFPRALLRLENACDAVLVDAPCSGMGTARRAPMMKWRLTPETLAKHARKQLKLLELFARAVKPGGTLVYATCSLMAEENERVVEAFLAARADFALEALAPVFAERSITVPGLAAEAGTLTLSPSAHGTDGFFVARLRREFGARR